MIISQIKKRTKNLFNINAAELSANCELVGNGIKFNGSGSFDIILPAGIYTISCKNNGLGPCYIRNGKVSSGYISSLSSTESVKTFNFTADVDGYLRISASTSGQYLEDIQIEKGVTATEYSPYELDITQLNSKPISNVTINGIDYHFAEQSESTDGVCKHAVEEPIIDLKVSGNSVQDGEPTPDNPVEVESVGIKTKNLLDYNELYVAGKIEIIDNGIQLSSYSHTTTITPEKFLAMTGLKEGDQIITSFNKKIIEGTINTMFGVFMFYKKSSAASGTKDFYIIRSGVQQNQEATVMSSVIPTGFNSTNFAAMTIYGGFVPEGGTVSTFEITNIQIEKGDSATEYEPYGYKIPVKVNEATTYIHAKEPLRKIGNYADYIDYKNKKIIRNTSSYTFIGTERATLKYSTEEKYNYETTTTANNSIINTIPMCNCLKGVSGNMGSTSIPLNHIRWSGYNGAYNIVVAQPTVAEMQAWLKSLIYQGNPMKIFYVLKTPIEEKIDVPEILTAKGRNNFIIDTTIAPSEFKVNYWKQIGANENAIIENVIQTDSNILIADTGADITQDGSNLLIGG